MSQVRYPAAHKVEAVRRVVENGELVRTVAGELGISPASLFFWVRRYRQIALGTRVSLELDPGKTTTAGSLVAHLRRSRRKAKPPNPAKQNGTSQT